MKESRKLAILKAIIRNGRISDQQIAKNIGTSQPTITRARSILNKDYILEYTVIPDLQKLGFEIMALTFVKTPSLIERANTMLNAFRANEKVLFTCYGQGFGYNSLIVSVHKNYADFADFRESIQGYAESFLVCIKTNEIIKHLSFRNLSV